MQNMHNNFTTPVIVILDTSVNLFNKVFERSIVKVRSGEGPNQLTRFARVNIAENVL